MTYEKAIGILKNILRQFEDMFGVGCVCKLWIDAEDIEALQMAIDLLKGQVLKDDDMR